MSLDVHATAREMARAVAAREVSARELLDLHVARIEQVNGSVNALVSLDPERARAEAAVLDEEAAHGRLRGPLHGLPFCFKDTHDVAGWRTTYGSPTHADHVPDRDELVVARVRAAGVVTLGRTNVPQMAAGSHTFNQVFGTTLNPWDLSRSAGGSSGGAGAALASGMVPLADGSDMGGSLRNPASFNGVVGLRPSLGRVPTWPTSHAWETTSVSGPLARGVEDLALLLSVMAGPDPRVQTALGDPGATFGPPLAGDLDGVRIGFSLDLGGAFDVDPDVRAVVEAQRAVLAGAGAEVVDAWPDLNGGEEVFRTLRAWRFHHLYADLLAADPSLFKPSLADNIRLGEGLSGLDVARAYAERSRLAEVVDTWFGDHDLLALPVSQVAPFPADQEYPALVDGREQATYLDWMRSAFLITVTGCPAISVPAGFTPAGLPVGLQLVARHGADRRLLELAAAFERATGLAGRRPTLP